MKVKANAKINKYLKVLSKRKDGFHELETVMIPIDLYDNIEITDSECDECICEGVEEEKNLAFKALKLFKKTFNIEKCAKIIIEKNIPSCAGLGGGSSDAAFVVKALNEMWETNKSLNELAELCEEIGSDVPFFVYNVPALVRGRGERVKEIKTDNIFGVLVFDGLQFSTKEVFKCFDERKEVKSGNEYCNDLEQGIVCCEGYEKIERIKKDLVEHGCEYALMTGSGSAVFGICSNYEEAVAVKKHLSGKYKKVFVFKNV